MAFLNGAAINAMGRYLGRRPAPAAPHETTLDLWKGVPKDSYLLPHRMQLDIIAREMEPSLSGVKTRYSTEHKCAELFFDMNGGEIVLARVSVYGAVSGHDLKMEVELMIEPGSPATKLIGLFQRYCKFLQPVFAQHKAPS